MGDPQGPKSSLSSPWQKRSAGPWPLWNIGCLSSLTEEKTERTIGWSLKLLPRSDTWLFLLNFLCSGKTYDHSWVQPGRIENRSLPIWFVFDLHTSGLSLTQLGEGFMWRLSHSRGEGWWAGPPRVRGSKTTIPLHSGSLWAVPLASPHSWTLCHHPLPWSHCQWLSLGLSLSVTPSGFKGLDRRH